MVCREDDHRNFHGNLGFLGFLWLRLFSFYNPQFSRCWPLDYDIHNNLLNWSRFLKRTRPSSPTAGQLSASRWYSPVICLHIGDQLPVSASCADIFCTLCSSQYEPLEEKDPVTVVFVAGEWVFSSTREDPYRARAYLQSKLISQPLRIQTCFLRLVRLMSIGIQP